MQSPLFLPPAVHTAQQPRSRVEKLFHRDRTNKPFRRRAVIRCDLGQEPLPDATTNPFRITELQDKLDDALATEQYINAANLRDELQSAKNEDHIHVLQALLQYYDAFNRHSLELLARIWLQDDGVTCQHPLTQVHQGYEDVMRSFESLFDTLPPDLNIQASDVRMQAFGQIALVTCVEVPHSSVLAEKNKGVRQHGLLSTSIFEKRRISNSDRVEYRMVHHISMPIIQGVSTL
ncbi:hypothetical protein BWQ96_00090 [Gracilariopsis chorda]|uniref:SnoaL-like domain-containing protein n=1 Tax=Gracilariopsis chorda TaxID=448386 RepID=A0A2V3JC27_9FLOR|nr:hypothetical protein BWQ96_00090 [Gracilariopsis chorda]|eukprot:PXF49930.1 hypothetical protein BWQ96_00090 [Gracilariopsis chorda]